VKSGSWPSIGLIYLHGVLTSASLSKIIPLQADYIAHAGLNPAAFAWLISLVTIPSAILATIGGSFIDRIGTRRALIAAATIGALINFAYLLPQAMPAFYAIRLFEGLIMVCAYSAAPALIMATTAGPRRGRAMALWSTYTPVGISLGLALSGNFAGTEHWRGGYAIHGSLFLALAAASLLLPQPPAAPARARPGVLDAYRQIGPLRLSLTFATLIFVGFGTSTVMPGWFSVQHSMSIGTASNVLAGINLMMIPGGLVAGFLLARGLRDNLLFLAISTLVIAASVALFWPGLAQTSRMTALVAWMMLSGASIAVVTSALPRVVRDATQGAAAAGLLSQLAALTTFATPHIWLPILNSGHWPLFIAVVAMGAVAGLLLFPRAATASSPAAAA
jgi:predicted MFS family arabinose efflux permease